MFSDTFDLEFLTDKDSKLLHPPLVRVRLKSYSLDGEGSMPIITPDCIGQIEFDEQIDKMIGELMEIKKTGRRKYAAWEKRHG